MKKYYFKKTKKRYKIHHHFLTWKDVLRMRYFKKWLFEHCKNLYGKIINFDLNPIMLDNAPQCHLMYFNKNKNDRNKKTEFKEYIFDPKVKNSLKKLVEYIKKTEYKREVDKLNQKRIPLR